MAPKISKPVPDHAPHACALGLLEQSPHSTQLFAPDGTTVAVNKAWEKLWGVTLADLKDYNILKDKQLREKNILPYIERAFAGEAADIPPIAYNTEETLPGRADPHNPIRWVRAFIYPVKDARGRIRNVVLTHEDVTARKELEIALERYRLLAENARDIVLFIRPDGKIAEANEAAALAYGYTHEELARLNIHDLRAPDTHGELQEQLAMARAGGIRFETVHRRKDGSTFPVEVSSRIKDILGEPLLFSIIRDITERKKAEKRERLLAEAGKILGSSLDYEVTLSTVCRLAVPELADWCSLDLVTANGQLRRIEIAHKDPRKVQLAHEYRRRFPPLESDKGGLMETLRTGKPQFYPDITDEMLAGGARNSEHFEMMRLLNIKSIMIVPLIARGNILGAITMVGAESGHRYVQEDMDFALEVASRIALAVDNARLFSESREMQKQLSLLVEASSGLSTSPDVSSVLEAVLALSQRMIAADAHAVWRFDSRRNRWSIGHANGLSAEYCDAVIDMLSGDSGLPKKPIIAADVTKFSKLESRSALYRKEGIQSVMIFPLTVRGAPHGKLAFYYHKPHAFSDLEISIATALSNLAASAISTAELYEELKANDKKKDEFLAMLAHELRNPIAPVSNALHIMKSQPANMCLQEEMIRIATHQINHMVRLLDDLLDVSRITHGKIIMQRERVNLCDVLHATIAGAKPFMDQRQHHLEVKLPASPLWVSGDAIRLAQMIGNLLTNAAKYTSPGGTITLESCAEDRQAVVRVSDNGIGIAAEKLPYIFDMFMQVDNSIERSQGGLGIGLMLVKNIAELHGGAIAVHSEGLGKGTQFRVMLPVLELQRQETVRQGGEKPASLAVYRILVVEDNEASAKTLGRMLEMLGHEVRIALTAKDAVSAAEDYRPQVVLMDIGMPDMNGYEICREMRAHPALEGTVFIAQSGWGQQQHMQQSRKTGFRYHLVKPVSFEALRDQLSKIHEQV